MKKLFIACLIILLGTGCFGGPLKRFLGIQKAEIKTEQKIDKNKDETTEKAKQFIHGTGTALTADPNPSKYSEVAYDLNKRAEIVLGPPNYKEALEIDKIVAGLLSTNIQIKVNAQKALDKKDNEIVGLQGQLKELQVKLGKIEEEKDALGLKNSQLANTWQKIKWWFWFIIWAVIGMFVFRVVMAVVPPPYNSVGFIVDGAFGIIGKLIFRALPKAAEYAHVVSKDIHQTSEKALHSLVDAIETIRHQEIKPEDVTPQAQNIQVKDLIDSTLLKVTDTDTREKILDVKKKLNLV